MERFILLLFAMIFTFLLLIFGFIPFEKATNVEHAEYPRP